MTAKSQEDFGGAGMCFDEKRIEPARFQIRGKRRVRLAQVFQDAAQIVIRRGKPGLQSNGALCRFACRLELPRFA